MEYLMSPSIEQSASGLKQQKLNFYPYYIVTVSQHGNPSHLSHWGIQTDGDSILMYVTTIGETGKKNVVCLINLLSQSDTCQFISQYIDKKVTRLSLNFKEDKEGQFYHMPGRKELYYLQTVLMTNLPTA